MTLPSLTLDRLVARGVRNLVDVELEAAPEQNLITGDNGQGKTSLLEAIYLAATSKSFRTARPREIARHGEKGFFVRARFTERRGDLPELGREQTVAYVDRTMQVKLDGNRPTTLAAYATRSPVVVFHADELALSSGPAAMRRRLLDRVALYLAPAALRASSAYLKALRSRHELLRRRGSPSEISAYEAVAARAGAELTRARAHAATELATDAVQAFADIGAPNLVLAVRYEPGGSDDEAAALEELARRRDTDMKLPAASFGPHRDDLSLRLGGRIARGVASQGQHRAITLALKAAESATIARFTGLEPIQLLDDVSSELDPARTEALFAHLGRRRSQLFVTTTRPDLVAQALDRSNTKSFRVVEGRLNEA